MTMNRKEWLAAQKLLGETECPGYECDIYGRFPWVLSERQGKQVNLSKASLGDFVFTILRNRGDIYTLWAFAPDAPRSAVFPSFKLTIEAKNKIQNETKFVIVPPARIVLS